MHQPFILNNQTSINCKEEVLFINEIWNKLRPFYDNFSILLHPRENLKLYQDRFQINGIKVIQQPNNYEVFLKSNLVIGHYSTVLLYPLFFRLETFIINYPGTKIDEVFKPYCQFFEDPEHIELHLQQMKESKDLKSDISGLIGPINSYENIANQILNLS